MTEATLQALNKEEARAVGKHGEGVVASDDRYLQIVVEEIGEVARAMHDGSSREEILREILEVASVSIRHLEGTLYFSGKP